jgi:uncharacterized membrane protein YgcG
MAMRRQRLILAAIIGIAVLLSIPATAATARLIVNGAEIVSDVAPQNVSGRVLVPIRMVAEALGLRVAWLPDAQAVTVDLPGESPALPYLSPGYIHLIVNGREIFPDVSPRIIEGRVMVPIRAISEALGVQVTWYQPAQAVIVAGNRVVVVAETPEELPPGGGDSGGGSSGGSSGGGSGGSSGTSVTVYITSTGQKYHRAGCQYLRESCFAISLADAKARGYGPCSVCDPPE